MSFGTLDEEFIQEFFMYSKNAIPRIYNRPVS